jgi:hypothetical protein
MNSDELSMHSEESFNSAHALLVPTQGQGMTDGLQPLELNRFSSRNSQCQKMKDNRSSNQNRREENLILGVLMDSNSLRLLKYAFLSSSDIVAIESQELEQEEEEKLEETFIGV